MDRILPEKNREPSAEALAALECKLESARREHEAEIAALASFEKLGPEIGRLVESIKRAGRKTSPLVRTSAGMLGKATSVLFTRVQYPSGMPRDALGDELPDGLPGEREDLRAKARADCDAEVVHLLGQTAECLGRIAYKPKGTPISGDDIEQLAHNAGELLGVAARDGGTQSDEPIAPVSSNDSKFPGTEATPLDQYQAKVLIALWRHSPVLMTVENVIQKTNFSRDNVVAGLNSLIEYG